MRKVATILGISHSSISRYKSGIYKKRNINIKERYPIFMDYLNTHYDRRINSIEVCVFKFKKYYKYAPCPTIRQIYNWINESKIDLIRDKLCYKKRKNKNKVSGMMQHTIWNLDNKTVLPIGLMPTEWFGVLESENEERFCAFTKRVLSKDESVGVVANENIKSFSLPDNQLTFIYDTINMHHFLLRI